jgi:DNA-binding beta-propeller fold protein YncE
MGAATAVLAGVPIGDGSQVLWGASWSYSAWDLVGDSPALPGENGFGVEGMTFYNGMLYASGDSEEAVHSLIGYDTTGPWGTLLASPMPVTLSTPSGSTWGPEGITVNTSGIGYGAFVGGNVTLVGVESENKPASDYPLTAGAIVGSNVGSLHTPWSGFDPDDIAFVPSLGQFAVINDPSRIDFFSHDASTLTPNGSYIDVALPGVGDAKGLALVSEAFAELITGQDVSGEAFLVAHESNELSVWSVSGSPIGTVQALTGGLGPDSEVESVAVDELNGRIYIGDEGMGRVVVFVPEPAACLALAALGLLARRR